jgi:hypothetical protein
METTDNRETMRLWEGAALSGGIGAHRLFAMTTRQRWPLNANQPLGPPGRRPCANDIVKPFRSPPANAGVARDPSGRRLMCL